MRSLALAAALALAPTLALAQSTEIPGSEFEAGNWIGGAYTDDRGAFSYCYITVSYQNGQDLWIGLYPNDTLSILLRQPDVKFQPGQKFELWVMMETGIPAIGNGEAWDADYGGITYDGIQATVDFLNSGRYLRMLGMGIDDGFDVDGIGPALVQAQDCLSRQGGGGGKVLGTTPTPGVKAPPKVPDLTKPKTSGVGSGGGLGTRPGGALGTPAPKPQP
ncbi:hypothetical protein [Tabrizicola sp.]|jgi:hypothetical protein|uniref:hypothetical protein n=1 Tax=Tabrizicola sp. TaxID=2005166 RepID=UPI0035B2AA8E